MCIFIRHRRIIISFLTLIASCSTPLKAQSTVDQSIAASQPTTTNSIKNEYDQLLVEIKSYNVSNPDINSWSMNAEHCFVNGENDLMNRVIAFVRKPGALDMLFDRLLAKDLEPDEILADSEMLIFAGEFYKTKDEVISGGKQAGELLDAARKGKFATAEALYPKAPIREKIEIAANRAMNNS